MQVDACTSAKSLVRRGREGERGFGVDEGFFMSRELRTRKSIRKLESETREEETYLDECGGAVGEQSGANLPTLSFLLFLPYPLHG